MCNARVLTAYESQRRLRRNYLEGARRKRLTFTPSGLWQAWKDLDAARKVYIGSIAGFLITVSPFELSLLTTTINNSSSYLLSLCSLDPGGFTQALVSSANHLIGNPAVEDSNGWSLTRQLYCLADRS